MAKHKVVITGINTAKLKVLKNKETMELLKLYRTGDICSYHLLIEGNLKLVLSVVQKFVNRYDNLDDIFQIGCIGLIKCINNFDFSKEVRFSTYAVPMIQGEIRRHLRDSTTLKISRQIKDLSYHSLKAQEEFIAKNNREPTVKELSKILNVTTYNIKEAIESTQNIHSLEDPVANDTGDSLLIMDQIYDETQNYEKLTQKLTINKGLNSLSNLQKEIIDNRYFKGKTQLEIAEEFNISQAQVSRLEKKALETLKDFF